MPVNADSAGQLRQPFPDRIKILIKTFAHTADVLTRDLPRWTRPLARSTAFFGMLFFGVVAFAIMMVISPRLFENQKRRFLREWETETRPVHELRLRARRLWVEESPQAAASHIRSVFDRLRASPTGVDVTPYGRFAGVMCMHDLASTAYEHELCVGRVAEALEIAEFMCSQHPSDIGLGPTWIVSKAKCLVRLGRIADAKALLLAHRNVYDSNAEVNQYLEELRSSNA